ncbi:hypothetical protein BGZ94_001642 [Podila epigama]|nr:hypothetical protein BGZ94_001642 [Podila epigama]
MRGSVARPLAAASSTIPLAATPLTTKQLVSDVVGTNHVLSERQQRSSTSSKTPEEIYLAQMQLLQMYMKQKQSRESFREEELSTCSELEAATEMMAQKQAEFMALKDKFEAEQDLVILEDSLGPQASMDTLFALMNELKVFKQKYEAFTTAWGREPDAPMDVSSLELTHLDQWLVQTRECQRIFNSVSKAQSPDRIVVYGATQTLSGLCNIVKRELEELKACGELLTKISQAKATELCLSTI